MQKYIESVDSKELQLRIKIISNFFLVRGMTACGTVQKKWHEQSPCYNTHTLLITPRQKQADLNKPVKVGMIGMME